MFHGSIVALVTPFKDDKIDVNSLRNLVEFHLSSGTHAIVAAGTTGEAGTLSEEEKLLVIKTVIEQAKERLPIIAGTAANATKDCISLTKAARSLGAHAALIMTPAYIKPSQEGLYQHYSQIAKAVSMPVILYNVPSRTACDIQPETVARLAKISNIIGIKDATGQLSRLQKILELAQDFDVFSGDDASAAEWMLAGAKGVISVTANIAAKKMAKLGELALDKDKINCLKMNEELASLHQLLFVESNPIPLKWALAKMGLIKDELRLPLTSLAPEFHPPLNAVLTSLKII